MAKTLALFDFDGTITTKDTFLELIKYQKGAWAFYKGMMRLSPYLLLFKAGLIPGEKMKVKVMEYFWKGIAETDFTQSCNNFYTNKIPSLIRHKALIQLKYHLNNGHDVSVVTASGADWVKPFCDANGINCIATILEKQNGKITGKITGNNCNNQEKVTRIK